MKLGRLARPSHARFLRFERYVKPEFALSPPPPLWDGSLGCTYPLYANDRYGDCTVAALAHLVAQQAMRDGCSIDLDERTVVGEYLALTGGSDTGAAQVDVLSRATSLGFPAGAVGRIDAWASVDPQNLDDVRAAASAFGGLYVGANLPLSITDPGLWRCVASPSGTAGSLGGHAMVLCAFDAEGPTFATWGGKYQASWMWWRAYVEEAYVVLTEDLRSRVVDWRRLLDDFAALRSVATLSGENADLFAGDAS
jgi:hypothetical protein